MDTDVLFLHDDYTAL